MLEYMVAVDNSLFSFLLQKNESPPREEVLQQAAFPPVYKECVKKPIIIVII